MHTIQVTHIAKPQIILIVMAVLVVLDVGLLMAAMARFKRARLILD
jgi:hypothetical protein